jgi:hypothetical protein
MLDSQIETLWQESLNTSRIPVQGGMSQTYDPIKVFAKKIAEYLVDQTADPVSKDQIRKACGLFERSSVVVSTVNGKSFEVKDAVVLTHEHLTEQEWRNYNSAAPMERRAIAKDRGTPLKQLIQLDTLLR